MNMVAVYAVASAVMLGYVFADVFLIIKNRINANKCQKHIKIKDVSGEYSHPILLSFAQLFVILYIITIIGDTFIYPKYEMLSFTENTEKLLRTVFFGIISARVIIFLIFGRTGYITENGITSRGFRFDKGKEQFSVKRNGSETLIRFCIKSKRYVTYALNKETEQEALALAGELFPECDSTPVGKVHGHRLRYMLFSYGCGLVFAGVLTAWYFVTMPVIMVGDKIVKTESECAIFCFFPSRGTAVIPGDILEKIHNAEDYSEKITSKDMTSLKKLSNLKYLDVMCNNIDDLTEIGGLTQLEMLRFGGGERYEKPTDYSPLKNLKNIKYFMGLGVYGLNDLTLFEDMDFVYFELTATDIQNGLDVICEKENLLNLNLYRCTAEDFSPIGKCIKLKYLELSGTNVTDLSFLENLKELEYLGISNINSEDYSVLLELPSLKYLVSGGCNIPDKIINELTEKGMEIYN